MNENCVNENCSYEMVAQKAKGNKISTYGGF